MSRNVKPGAPGAQPALRVVGSPAEARALTQQTQQAQQAILDQQSARLAQAEGMFSDKRSGRDRREDSTPVEDPRRQSPERRRGKAQAAWWLERDYVESHHFVQKPTSPRGRPSDEPPID